MICIKCGKKIEYETPTCKYCKEPVVLEGCSPMGDITSIASEPCPREVAGAVHYEMPLQGEHYEPRGIGFKKFIPLIVGGTCAMVLLVVAAFIGIPSKEEKKTSVVPIVNKEPKKVSDIYDSILEEAEKALEKKLKEKNNLEGYPPDYINELIPYLPTQEH